ncbi:hypothetical protein GOARA_045_00130 [Gordonia araii NBRC 100433]|uniref:Transmembrane protein n=1 Tax=Gordonia araii NBRC 100433 TaxID=1073574 RepID=G7H1D4_9ACTN|nr:hypothetical protein [Gordonia araii]NNG97833.1 hypothetical protein [Gordonia araii NBRC 100433]GAB09659.1 hypothetical protein GOARA_045_00130 [Gordonia araii NBRC 100433]
MSVPQPVAGGSWPEPPKRPTLASSIAIATELWLVVIAAMAVAQLGSYPVVRDAMIERRNTLPKDASESVRRSAELMTNTGVIVAISIVTVLIGATIALAAMYFARSGYNWGRLILAGLSAYVVVGAIMAFGGASSWTQAPQIIAGGCAAGALLCLMRRDADTYCREMAEFRTAAKAPALPTAGTWQQPWQPPQYGTPQYGPAQPEAPQTGPSQPGSPQPGTTPPSGAQPPETPGGSRE